MVDVHGDARKRPSRVKITSDGLSFGTRIEVDGNIIPATGLEFSVDPQQGFTKAVITTQLATLEFEGDMYLKSAEETEPRIRPGLALVHLFKDSGKWYTEEHWPIPEDAIGPYDMINSPNWRRIGNGAVLVPTQEPWGFPHLFPNRMVGDLK